MSLAVENLTMEIPSSPKVGGPKIFSILPGLFRFKHTSECLERWRSVKFACGLKATEFRFFFSQSGVSSVWNMEDHISKIFVNPINNNKISNLF
jgi:hypothetical protein